MCSVAPGKEKDERCLHVKKQRKYKDSHWDKSFQDFLIKQKYKSIVTVLGVLLVSTYYNITG
jgi:hypothetical protein